MRAIGEAHPATGQIGVFWASHPPDSYLIPLLPSRGHPMAEKFVYYMHRLNKTYPPQKEVLKQISLSFYYGAKIGIIGYNGSGKSTLMRIMAGIDKDFQGEAWLESGRTVGYLPQEPKLDETLDVKGNVELAVKDVKDIMDEFNALSLKFGEPMSDAE